MATVAVDTGWNRACSMCPGHHSAAAGHGSSSWVTNCERLGVPIVSLKRHSGSPTAGEWRRLETDAKRAFPRFRWQRPLTFNHHYYLHAVGIGMSCNLDHGLAA